MKTDVYADAESVAHEAAKIWFTWDSVRMATRLRWCRETRAVQVTGADVALTGIYHGRRRMTTYPVINRSRRRLWLASNNWSCRASAKRTSDFIHPPSNIDRVRGGSG